MKVKRQIALAQLVIGLLWLLLTGGCTAQVALEEGSDTAAAFPLLALWIGGACTAPAVYLMYKGVKGLFRSREAVGLLFVVAAAVLLDGALIIVRSARTHDTALGLLVLASFALAPGIAYGASAWRIHRLSARQAGAARDAFD